MRQKKNIAYPITIALLAGLLLLSIFYTPAIAQPGTANDPLVSQRYVDERVAELQAQIALLQAQIVALQQGQGQPPGDGTPPVGGQVVPFTPLFVPRGSTLIAEAGVEFILRSGSANVIAGPNGLVDVTAGRDVANGQAISRNHLILVPATDGRGLSFVTDAWLMIKGGYAIVN